MNTHVSLDEAFYGCRPGWDLAARFPRFPGVEFQGRKIVKNSPLVDAYRTETAHDKGADSRIILVRFWY